MNYKILKEENIEKLKNNIGDLNLEEINLLFLKTCQYGFVKSFNYFYENYNNLDYSDGFKKSLENGHLEIVKKLHKFKQNKNYDKEIFSCLNKGKTDCIAQLYEEKIITISFDHINQLVLKNNRNIVEPLLNSFKEKNIGISLNVLLTLSATFDNNCIDLFIDKNNYDKNTTAFGISCNNSLHNYKILKNFINYNDETILSMFKSKYIEIKNDSLKYLSLIDQNKLEITALQLLLKDEWVNHDFIFEQLKDRESYIKLILHKTEEPYKINIIFKYIEKNNITLHNIDIFKILNNSYKNTNIKNNIENIILKNKTNFDLNSFKNSYQNNG